MPQFFLKNVSVCKLFFPHSVTFIYEVNTEELRKTPNPFLLPYRKTQTGKHVDIFLIVFIGLLKPSQVVLREVSVPVKNVIPSIRTGLNTKTL